MQTMQRKMQENSTLEGEQPTVLFFEGEITMKSIDKDLEAIVKGSPPGSMRTHGLQRGLIFKQEKSRRRCVEGTAD